MRCPKCNGQAMVMVKTYGFVDEAGAYPVVAVKEQFIPVHTLHRDRDCKCSVCGFKGSLEEFGGVV